MLIKNYKVKNDPTLITRVNRQESLEEESAWPSVKGDETVEDYVVSEPEWSWLCLENLGGILRRGSALEQALSDV